MSLKPVVEETEHWLRQIAADATAIRKGECLLCYVYRMLEYGCTGLRWAQHYRDVCAPRATGLEKRLGNRGGFCDCEIFMNGYDLAEEHWVVHEPYVDESGFEVQEDPTYPEPLPACRGVRRGSTQGCGLWVRQYRGW